MEVLLLLALLVCPVLQLSNIVVHHGHEFLHTNHVIPCLPSVGLEMVDKISNIVGRHIDPASTLSNEDLIKLLIDDTNTKVSDLWKDIKEELNLDRKHNKEVVESVVVGFCKRLDNLEKFVVEHSSEHSKLIADLDLKHKTISSYQEQLICDLGNKVHDLQSRLNNHEISWHALNVNQQKCNDREETSNSIGDFVVHEGDHHGVAYFHCL